MLDGTEVGESSSLSGSSIDDVDDAYFNFSNAVIRHGSSLYDIEMSYDEQTSAVIAKEKLVHLSPDAEAVDAGTCAYRLDKTLVLSELSDGIAENAVYIDRYAQTTKKLADGSFSRVIFKPYY